MGVSNPNLKVCVHTIRHDECLGINVGGCAEWSWFICPSARPRTISGAATGLQDIPYATSVTALQADTGQVAWARQLVHHDLWDLDTNAAPTLVDIQKNGKTIPALVQTTKQGFLFVLDRLTGTPIYPIAEQPVPKSDVPGEMAATTQPMSATARAHHALAFPGHLHDRRHSQPWPMQQDLCALSR